jgi:hypothetical protein
MFQELLKLIREEYSGAAAKDHVARIAGYHRIQASPGYRAAARYVHDAATRAGLSVETLSAPAKEGYNFWGYPGFQEWEGREATLHLVEPEKAAAKLADFHDCKISLIQRSAPVAPVTAEVVVLEDGTKPEEYANLDVKGKIVLTRGEVGRVQELAVERFGAIGILYDGMREWPPVRPAFELPKARQYTSFWWGGGETRCFGFVLTPRQGLLLRQLLKEGKPVKVRAHVDSLLYDGAMEIVAARIPGDTEEEIVIVAHLCHPQPSANDNASGAGALLEAATVLQRLIAQGKLRRPKRSIRFFWLPEMTGTYAYLSGHEDEIPRMVAGLNLDMVGEDQDKCGSVWIVEYTPEALPSFVGDLMAAIQEGLGGGLHNFAGNESFPLFRHAASRFSGGSDHYILSDPSVGVPTPMLIQWPDRYYHTSEDTLDKVSPMMLGYVGAATATYAYFLADAGLPQAQWLAQEMLTRYQAVTARRAQEVINEALAADKVEKLAQLLQRLSKKATYWAGREREALSSLRRLASHVGPAIDQAQARAAQVLEEEIRRAKEVILEQARQLGAAELSLSARELDAWEKRAAQLTPRKKHRGPLSLRGFLRRFPPERRDEIARWQETHKKASDLPTLALYWTDGKRNLLEIADLVEMESDQRDVEYLAGYYELLRVVGLVEYV